MNGRLEREMNANTRMNDRLENLPTIFTEFYFSLDANGKSYTTLYNYISHTVDFMNYITGNNRTNDFYTDVTHVQINRYMSSIRRKIVNGEVVRMGDDIVAARWSSLNSFFGFLEDNGYIKENPMARTSRPKIKTEHQVTYLTEDEITHVLQTIKTQAKNKKLSRDLCLVSLALSTGLRVSALTQINIDDIDLTKRTIKVIEKGHKVRLIPFGTKMQQLIEECIADRHRSFAHIETEALFVSQWGKRMTTQAVRDLVKKYTGDIEGKKITPHKLRASAATNLAAKGTSIQAIAKILGHENIQTTRRYVAVLDKETEEAVNKLDEMI